MRCECDDLFQDHPRYHQAAHIGGAGRKIADNAADKTLVDLDMLMRANGMRLEGEPNKEDTDDRAREYLRIKQEVRSIIAEELFARNCMLIVFSDLATAQERFGEKNAACGKFDFYENSSFCIRIKGVEPMYQNFIMDVGRYRFGQECISSEKSIDDRVRAFIQDNSCLFLKDAWEKEMLAKIKNTFVFTDVQLYERFCEMMKEIRVNSDMSALLIDIVQRKVLSEMLLVRYDGAVHGSIFDTERLD